MNVLDLTLPTPPENLAADEALLEAAETGAGGEALRFWESPQPFVVLGYANKAAVEVNLAVCEARGIPVLRRCSGGGTVVQGPGCLNYALVLRMVSGGPFEYIGIANHYIMRRNRAALETVLNRPVAVRGYTDLAVRDLKFSGNSQRRQKKFLLFHGTILLDFDLTLVNELLPMPSKQPSYRENRRHDRFLTNLNVPAEKVKAALCQTWNANAAALLQPPLETIAALVHAKYATREWNFKF